MPIKSTTITLSYVIGAVSLLTLHFLMLLASVSIDVNGEDLTIVDSIKQVDLERFPDLLEQPISRTRFGAFTGAVIASILCMVSIPQGKSALRSSALLGSVLMLLALQRNPILPIAGLLLPFGFVLPVGRESISECFVADEVAGAWCLWALLFAVGIVINEAIRSDEIKLKECEQAQAGSKTETSL